MKKITEKTKCTGCGLCSTICPKNAIVLELDKYGFYTPNIDKKKCIECNLCNKICISNNTPNFINNDSKWYLTQENTSIESKCSSGGSFLKIAESIIDEGGYVCGATLIKQEGQFICRHKIVNNKSEIKQLLGSKYIQSEAFSCFKEIKELANANNKILFVGTPCQVEALKIYCNNNKNIIFCDLLCFGVLSTKLLNIYVNKLENEYKKEIVDIQFRNKFKNLKGTYFSFIFEDGSSHNEGAHFSFEKPTGLFKAFSSANFNRESCFNCQFKNPQRVGDITFGDIPLQYFVKEKDNLKAFDTNRGISIISCNKNLLKYFTDPQEIALSDFENFTPAFKRSNKPFNYYKLQRKLKYNLFKKLFNSH